jgi:phytoene synthase
MDTSKLAAALTKRSRSNFYYAFRFLPRDQREAIYTIYAFCRTVDDIVDLSSDVTAQRQLLTRWRQELARCYHGAPDEQLGEQLAHVVRSFSISRTHLEAIIDGVEMDLDRNRYETFDELYEYCYRVASAVGLCCIEVFGCTAPSAHDYAVKLGVALQLTNIMRDLKPDAERGRIYLPLVELKRFNYPEADLLAGRYTPAFVELMHVQAERARGFYQGAWAAYPKHEARRLVAAESMGQIYYALFRTIEASEFRVFDRRIRIHAGNKLLIALRCWMKARFI